ncbi:2-oxoadipate dioxygenase/decarboxylase family protein, partial [Rhizobium ruizarguesonis]
MSRSFPMPQAFVSPGRIRSLFTEAMSQMYRAEVPQYGTLIELVADVNAGCLEKNPDLRDRLAQAGELERIDVERHGAIRLGTADELFTIRRL